MSTASTNTTRHTQRFTVAEIARQVGGDLIGAGDIEIAGIASLDDAGPTDITFINSDKHVKRWAASRAAAAIVSRFVKIPDPGGTQRAVIAVDNADLSVATVLDLFAPPPVRPEAGIDPSARVAESATIAGSARIGAFASVGRRCRIGENVILHDGVRLYDDVEIGPETEIHANTVIRERCMIGARVVVHSNTSIGTDGFGYRPFANGSGLRKMTHIGRVIIEDDVEIGANACVDRGKFGDTVIGAGTKIDNLVQIGHNCRIGRHCVIAGQAGLSGSVIVGDWVQIGGQAGLLDHVRIGKGVQIAGQSGVMDDLPEGARVFGLPAVNRTQALRQIAALHKLPELLRELRQGRQK